MVTSLPFFCSGVIVDREVLILLGQESCRIHRGESAEIPTGLVSRLKTCLDPQLTCHWAQSFRRRHGLKRLRKASTDRPPLGLTEVAQVRAWREELQSVMKEPNLWGVPSAVPIHPSLVLAADETPLVYIPRSKGTYNGSNDRATYILGEGDKRQVTCTQG